MAKNNRPSDEDIERVSELLDSADRAVVQAQAAPAGSDERRAFLIVAEGYILEAKGLIRAVGD